MKQRSAVDQVHQSSHKMGVKQTGVMTIIHMNQSIYKNQSMKRRSEQSQTCNPLTLWSHTQVGTKIPRQRNNRSLTANGLCEKQCQKVQPLECEQQTTFQSVAALILSVFTFRRERCKQGITNTSTKYPKWEAKLAYCEECLAFV